MPRYWHRDSCVQSCCRVNTMIWKRDLSGSGRDSRDRSCCESACCFRDFFLICAECDPVCVGGYLPLDILQAGKVQEASGKMSRWDVAAVALY